MYILRINGSKSKVDETPREKLDQRNMITESTYLGRMQIHTIPVIIRLQYATFLANKVKTNDKVQPDVQSLALVTS